MSKVYEWCIHNNLSSYTKSISSISISAYKKSYGSNHLLLRHRKLKINDEAIKIL